MNPHALWAALRFDLKVTFVDKIAVFFLLLFPLGLYLFFAALAGALDSSEAGRRYYEANTSNFAAVLVLNIALLNLAPGAAMAKQLGLLQRLLVTPLPVSQLWLASTLRALVIYLLGYLLLIGCGFALFRTLPAASLANLAIPALVTALAMLPLGFLIGMWFDKVQTAFYCGMLVMQPMLVLSGAGFPVEGFPMWAQALSALIPFTHAVRIMQLGWEGRYFTAAAMAPTAILAGVGLVCAMLSVAVFRRRFQ